MQEISYHQHKYLDYMTITPYLLITYRMINTRMPIINKLIPKRDPKTLIITECLLLSTT